MRMVKNMLWMVSGVGVGIMANKYSKDVIRYMKKGKREASRAMKNMTSN